MSATTTRKVKRGAKIMDPHEREAFKAQRQAEERERIESAVRELTSSEGWARWIRVRSLFHSYSWQNCALIALQCPDATRVAGYRTWQKVGRNVIRGEKSIKIMAPMSVRVRGESGESQRPGLSTFGSVGQQVAAQRKSLYEGGEQEAAERRTIYRAVSVFDIGQTTGEDLPEPPSGAPIEGDELAEWLPRLEAFARRDLGYSVEVASTAADPALSRGALGYADREAKRIVVSESLCPNARVRVLTHEIAHACGVGYDEYGRADAEVMVESAAIIVCGALGLDVTGESVPYIAGWGKGDVAALRKYAATVDALATRIESGIGVDR